MYYLKLNKMICDHMILQIIIYFDTLYYKFILQCVSFFHRMLWIKYHTDDTFFLTVIHGSVLQYTLSFLMIKISSVPNYAIYDVCEGRIMGCLPSLVEFWNVCLSCKRNTGGISIRCMLMDETVLEKIQNRT